MVKDRQPISVRVLEHLLDFSVSKVASKGPVARELVRNLVAYSTAGIAEGRVEDGRPQDATEWKALAQRARRAVDDLKTS